MNHVKTGRPFQRAMDETIRPLPRMAAIIHAKVGEMTYSIFHLKLRRKAVRLGGIDSYLDGIDSQ